MSAEVVEYRPEEGDGRRPDFVKLIHQLGEMAATHRVVREAIVRLLALVELDRERINHLETQMAALNARMNQN